MPDIWGSIGSARSAAGQGAATTFIQGRRDLYMCNVEVEGVDLALMRR